MFNSLRVRLTLIFVTLTIVPLVLAGTLISTRAYTTLQNQAVDFQEQNVRQAASQLQAFFLERLNELNVLIDIYGFDTLESSEQRDTLLALLAKQPAFYQFTLINAGGQEDLRLTRGEIVTNNDLTNRAEDPLFQRVLETNNLAFSQVHFDEEARDRLIDVALPIYDLFTGELDHVLVAEIQFRNISENVLRQLNLENGEDVYIVDNNNIIIAHRDPSYVLSDTTYDVPETNGLHTGLNGTDVVLAKETIAVQGLSYTVIAENSFENAFALAFDNAQIAAVITVVTLLISVAVVALVVTRVVNPIVRLSGVARAIQAGDFSQKTEVNRKDEIGQFAAAFNAMTEAIQKRETDLRNQADELRIATAKAKEAARVKGEFLANVSHELRTPLNAIIGFSDMLLAGMNGPLNEKQSHKLNRLKENGTRLLALINELLDLTRIESGRLEMVEKEFSPRALAERLTAQMESLAVESKLHFETNISRDMPDTLMGDEKRVEQVVVNLLSNAFKFTKEGSVTLSLDANPAEKTWSLEVADTGVGIPPHALNVIFEEFRQLDGSYSRAYKGSGLGLAITRNLVRMMGGKIGVKSTLGSGSTFTVTLPMYTQPAAEPLVLEAASD